MTPFLESITGVVADLHQAGFTKDADDLQHLANLASDQSLSTDTRRDVLRQIEMRCHVKWLGDFYLPHLSQKEWWGKLEKLHRSARKQGASL